MSSLTPKSRRNEALDEVMKDGFWMGSLVLIPSMSAIYMAMRHSPIFVQRTNWQSRTAMAIMPALFAFAFTAESRLHEKMVTIANEEERKTKLLLMEHTTTTPMKNQSNATNTMQNYQLNNNNNNNINSINKSNQEIQHELMALYQKSLAQSHVKFNIVDMEELSWHHKLGNYVSANPIKALSALAIPSIGMILYGRAGQEHLKTSIKVLHTRVFGQFTVLALLLSIMGFKDYMQHNGIFITKHEALHQEEEMKQIRQQLLERLNNNIEKNQGGDEGEDKKVSSPRHFTNHNTHHQRHRRHHNHQPKIETVTTAIKNSGNNQNVDEKPAVQDVLSGSSIVAATISTQ